MSDVIVLWAASESSDECVWLTNAPAGVRVVLVAPGGLAQAIRGALVRGPVVAIVGSDRDAHRALALGVDEVVHGSAASPDTLAAAAESARLRAMGRASRNSAAEGDERAIELLAAAVSYRLADPLALASLNVEILRAAMSAMRPSAPQGPGLQASLNDLASALREASEAVAQVFALVAPDQVEGACGLTTVVSEVAELVRVVVERTATLRVELPREHSLRVTFPRSLVVQALSTLLTNALQAVRDRQEGTITVRVEPRVAAAIVEVTDNGGGMSPAVLDRVLDPAPATRSGAAGGLSLSLLSQRVRHAGGDIVLESERGVGTTARLFVPLHLRGEAPHPRAN